jgi:hypothetical protein
MQELADPDQDRVGSVVAVEAYTSEVGGAKADLADIGERPERAPDTLPQVWVNRGSLCQPHERCLEDLVVEHVMLEFVKRAG